MYKKTIMQWYKHVQIRNSAHRKSARKYEYWNNLIGFIAIFAAIIAGYEVTQQQDGKLATFTIIIGVFAIIAALSNAALKFFGFEKLKQRHHTAATQYATLQFEMDRWRMVSEEDIPDDFYENIKNQLSEIDKSAPLISEYIINKVKNQTFTEIPKRFFYDIKLVEKWKDDNGGFVEIGNNPVRSYICEPLEMEEYLESREIIIKNRHTMVRDENKHPIILHGEGIIDNNIGFIHYSVLNKSNRNITYGTMVLMLTNRARARGYWMTAGVIGADFLIGSIELVQRANGSQEAGGEIAADPPQ